MEEGFQPYHAFINHRGPDVKRTLASLIYYALKREGLSVFLDKQELEVRDSLTAAIKSAIRSASVQIAIFSKTYAKSTWCLDELLWMLENPFSTIIPVYHGIKSSDLENVALGAYAEAMKHHRERGRDVEKWIAALEAVPQRSPSYVVWKEEDDSGERLQELEQIVVRHVRRDRILYECEQPVGLRQAAEHFENKVLNPRESTGINVVGIVGLARSGKSTLVTHLYNSKYSQFKRCCFLSEVNKNDLPSLQETLLRDLLRDQYIQVENTRRGKAMLQDRLPVLPPVLIVLDDIATKVQIEYLLFVKDFVANGSLILVTCRDESLLVSSKVKIYNVNILEEKHAQELFRWHAFGSDTPPHDLQDTVEEFVRMCDGFPGALIDLAKELRNKGDSSKWKQHLESLRNQRQNNVLKQIYIWLRGFWLNRMLAAFSVFIRSIINAWRRLKAHK